MTDFCAITAIYSPANYRSRFRLYQDFRKRMEDSGMPLYTIELAIGDQEFAVTKAGNPFDFQIHSNDAVWYKENLLNIAIRNLPPCWKYVAWLDADIMFVRPDWASHTLALLKQHRFVQMFSHVVDLGPRFEPLKIYEGFAYRYLVHGQEGIGRTGFAWAARREVLESIGGLIDWCLQGAGDYFMALALAGAITPASTRRPGSNYAKLLLDWQKKCEPHRDFGYLDTTILHFWHGRLEDRRYTDRWRILADNDFDPDVDLRRDDNGLIRLSGNKPALRDALRDYFRSLNEDSAP